MAKRNNNNLIIILCTLAVIGIIVGVMVLARGYDVFSFIDKYSSPKDPVKEPICYCKVNSNPPETQTVPYSETNPGSPSVEYILRTSAVCKACGNACHYVVSYTPTEGNCGTPEAPKTCYEVVTQDGTCEPVRK